MSDFAEEEEDGSPITKKAIKESIKKHKLYITPELNDVLYLHYSGFTKIENLDPFINLKALWLNNNAISTIEGLDQLQNLRSLYLQNNIIEKISGLDKLSNLDTLCLSTNFIQEIEGLGGCTKLSTIELDHNKLMDPSKLSGLLEAPSLTIINLSNNMISDERFLDIISGLQKLRVLRMEGNAVTRNMKNYRRRIILQFPDLRYLDDAPVTDEERRLVNAWKEGGIEAEKRERQLIKQEKDLKHEENMKQFYELRKKSEEKNGETPPEEESHEIVDID
ncbi:Leucine Rich Repeat family protein [Histomonas meleagridis]|uniref:Leucine Rich Repeat family protein n=1 Tax=Histomonas meleagridis TaxID=135588 RepID=UPI0035593B07|nr:Leucine Rich Repeat family protein [Histomonas meleagridis]KAH0799312.1 Leucine Rich Repeat family protein [Histomonas meleagridis]